MPSGWSIYYVLCLSAVVALSIPAVLAAISFLIKSPRAGAAPPPSRSDRQNQASPPIPEALRVATERSDGDEIGRRFNTRFFRGTNASLALITLALLIIPCAAALGPDGDKREAAFELLGILSLVGLAALGLLYSARKGDLNWITLYRRTDEKDENSKTPGERRV